MKAKNIRFIGHIFVIFGSFSLMLAFRFLFVNYLADSLGFLIVAIMMLFAAVFLLRKAHSEPKPILV